MADIESLRRFLGARVRGVRTEAGVRQEDVAVAAREYGLKWTESRVAALERGDKALPAEELLLLPLILLRAGCGPCWISDLLPIGDDAVLLAGRQPCPGDLLQSVLTRKSTAGKGLARYWHMFARLRRLEDQDEDVNLCRDSRRSAEQSAARRLQISPIEIAARARSVWGRSLTEERDARAAVELPKDAPSGTVAATRSRITRALYAEIREPDRA